MVPRIEELEEYRRITGSRFKISVGRRITVTTSSVAFHILKYR
jgi:hypothetical protein